MVSRAVGVRRLPLIDTLITQLARHQAEPAPEVRTSRPCASDDARSRSMSTQDQHGTRRSHPRRPRWRTARLRRFFKECQHVGTLLRIPDAGERHGIARNELRRIVQPCVECLVIPHDAGGFQGPRIRLEARQAPGLAMPQVARLGPVMFWLGCTAWQAPQTRNRRAPRSGSPVSARAQRPRTRRSQRVRR